MKCKAVRHHLLASERPARPAAVVADHLAHCPACRSWQRQLARIERLVPELRVPPANGKLDCVREVIHGTAYGRDGQRETSWQRRERALRKVAVTFALAAGLLFFALVMYAWQHQRDEHWASNTSPSQPEILRLVKHYDDGKGPLWDAPPRERVTRLAKMVDALHAQVRQRTHDGAVNDLPVLAHHYDVLVQDGIVAYAREIPSEDRAEVLGSIAEQLSRAESEARRLAKAHPLANTPLDRIAVAAHNGHIELKKLIEGQV